MSYSNIQKDKKRNLATRIKIKFGKMLAQYVPNNKIRVKGLKLCGFDIGQKVYIGPDLIVASIISESGCSLTIGERVAIGPRVTLVLSSDANWSRITEQIAPIKGEIILEDDCWIGAGVIILPGITIGKGAVVGAGSIVTKSVEPFTVVIGNPANMIKKIKEF